MRQIHIYIRDEENMDNTERTVDSKSVEDSLAHITEIATRFQICAQQRLMIMDSKGKTAEELAKMYDNILLVVKKMQELVEQTGMLIDSANRSFTETDNVNAQQFK